MIRRCHVENGRVWWTWHLTPDEIALWVWVGATLASLIGLLFV
jgi:hypothetical protein